MLPSSYVACAEAQAIAVLELVEALEELDDVQNVYTNADLPESVLGG